MGKSKNANLAHGTRGNPQYTLAQETAEIKAKELAEKEEHTKEELTKKVEKTEAELRDEMVKPLVEAGVKFTKEDVIFVTKDKTGQLIWLEKGNEGAGLEHIVKKHSNDFKNKFNVSNENLTGYINDFITNGQLFSSYTLVRNGRETLEKIYKKGNEYFLLTGIGTNGFIVTAYPIDGDEALKIVRRHKK